MPYSMLNYTPVKPVPSASANGEVHLLNLHQVQMLKPVPSASAEACTKCKCKRNAYV